MASGAAAKVTTSHNPITSRRRRAEKDASRENHGFESVEGGAGSAIAVGAVVDVTAIGSSVAYPRGYPEQYPGGYAVGNPDVVEVGMQLPEPVVDDVRKRLRRAAGQVQAVERMLVEGKECRDVVTQLSAATKALEQAGFKLVAAGLTYCLDNPDDAAADGYPLEAVERMFMKLA
jgi:DNA-binding FrmR family transcriptional regulator